MKSLWTTPALSSTCLSGFRRFVKVAELDSVDITLSAVPN